MSIHDDTALSGRDTRNARALALCVPCTADQPMGIDDFNAYRAGTRKGGP